MAETKSVTTAVTDVMERPCYSKPRTQKNRTAVDTLHNFSGRFTLKFVHNVPRSLVTIPSTAECLARRVSIGIR